MKKQMITMTAALMSLCLTACGSDPVNINVSLADNTTTSIAAETTSSETTAAVTETAAAAAQTEVSAAAQTDLAQTTAAQTDSAQTTAAQTDPAQTTAAQTAAAQTTDAAKTACPYSADDLVGEWAMSRTFGEWAMSGTFGTRTNSLTVRKDGTAIMRYGGGGTRSGKVRIDTEDHPDGSESYWYSICDTDNTAWISFACDKQPVNQINSGQDGGMQFIRISLEDVAAEKMNILTFLMKSLSGGAVDLATNANETMTADGQTYTLVTDERFAINSLGKAAFERLLEETVTGSEYTRWKGILDESFRVSEPDGSSYILTSNAHGYQSFETGSGVTITDQTDTSFTATTKDANQIDGRGVAHFVFDGINWTIESYEFQ